MSQEQQDFLELLRSLSEQNEANMTRCSQEFARLCVPALAAAGVRELVIDYSGSGDSGGVDYVGVLGDDGKKLAELSGPADRIASLLDDTAADAFDAFVNSLLPQGFEINEGGQGSLTLDVVTGKWAIDHSQNVCTTEDSHEEGKF